MNNEYIIVCNKHNKLNCDLCCHDTKMYSVLEVVRKGHLSNKLNIFKIWLYDYLKSEEQTRIIYAQLKHLVDN